MTGVRSVRRLQRLTVALRADEALPGDGQRADQAASRVPARRKRSLAAGARTVVRLQLTARGTRAVRARAAPPPVAARRACGVQARRRRRQRPHAHARRARATARRGCAVRSSRRALLVALAAAAAPAAAAPSAGRRSGAQRSPTLRRRSPAGRLAPRLRDRAGRAGAGDRRRRGAGDAVPRPHATVRSSEQRARAALDRVRARLRDCSGRFYVYLTARARAATIEIREYRRSAGGPERRRPGERAARCSRSRTRAVQPQRRAAAVRPDGKLWRGHGRRRRRQRPVRATPRTRLSLLGKLLRLDPARRRR